MAEKTEFLQAIDDAILDADSLERFINGSDSETVLTRLSAEYPTLKKAIKQMFDAGGLPSKYFSTYKEMVASSEIIVGEYAVVSSGNNHTQGVYRKLSTGFEKADFLGSGFYQSSVKKSKNLIDMSSIQVGRVVQSDGSIRLDNSDVYYLSDYIPVQPSTRYIAYTTEDGAPAYVYGIAIYDKDKGFISARNTWDNVAKIANVPSNGYYIRVNLYNADKVAPNASSVFVGGGSDTSGFEPTVNAPYSLSNVYLDNVKLSEDMIDSVFDKVVETMPNLDVLNSMLVKNTNLWTIAGSEQNKYIMPDGSIVDDDQFAVSDYIELEPDSVYGFFRADESTAVINGYAVYDINKSFLRRVLEYGNGKGSFFRSPIEGGFVRFNFNYGLTANTYGERMLAKTNVRIPYVPATGNKYKLSGVDADVSSEVIKHAVREIVGEGLQEKSKYAFTHPLNLTYKHTSNMPSVGDNSNFDKLITSSGVYDLFDALMSESDGYMTKKVLGSDNHGNELVSYTLKNNEFKHGPDYRRYAKRPRIFLNCSIHGSERLPALAMYLLTKLLVQSPNVDPVLQVLRYDVDITFIPICNPSGWNSGTYANIDGINIERNFPHKFVVNTGAGTDTSPLTAPETGLILSEMEANRGMDLFVDFHNFFGTEGDTNPPLLWLHGYAYEKHDLINLSRAWIQKMTNHWQSTYDFLPQDASAYYGYTSTNALGGTARITAAEVLDAGLSTTLEINNNMPQNPNFSRYNEEHSKMIVEAFATFLVTALSSIA